jgi:hypothetical protein
MGMSDGGLLCNLQNRRERLQMVEQEAEEGRDVLAYAGLVVVSTDRIWLSCFSRVILISHS